MTAKQKFLLQLADTAFIQSHRLQETVGHAPKLEIEMALCNMGLDLLGQSRFLYQMVAKEIDGATEDSLAFGRDSWDVYNLLLAEMPNEDFDSVVAKNYYLAQFTKLLYKQLAKSTALDLVAFAQKSLKELQYHVEYFSGWVIRLGDGTELSQEKMQKSIDMYWDYIGEFFTPVDYETKLDSMEFPIDFDTLKSEWNQEVKAVLAEAKLTLPEGTWSQQGGKDGQHTEHHGNILAQTQFLQKSYPDMQW